MKYVRFKNPEGKEKYGILNKDAVKELKATYFKAVEENGISYSLNEICLLAPSTPSKIVAVGLNYKDHIKEMKLQTPRQPVIFIKPSSAVLNPDDAIEIPASVGQVDYEAEFALVIKKECRNIKKEDAEAYILGYTCLNDVTARHIQALDGQWTRAKGYDTFAPFGPYIDDAFDPGNTEVKLLLNGEVKQHSNTREFLFPVEELVSFISGIMTLYPGDVITTGTPSGIGPLQAGDRVEVILSGEKNEMILRNGVTNR